MVRLVSEVVTFRGAANAAFNQIRQYARTNVALHVRMLETIAAVAEFTQSPDDRAALLAQAEMLRAAARDAVPEERDRADIEERFDTARRALSTPERSA